MIVGKIILAVVLLTSGWQPGSPAAGTATGRAVSYAYCTNRFYYTEYEYIDIEDGPLCLSDHYSLYYDYSPYPTAVSRETWKATK